MKLPPPFLGHLAKRAAGLFDGETRPWSSNLQQKGKTLFNSAVGKFDGVTREEFDEYRTVLCHTRERLEQMIQRVEQLEAQLSTQKDAESS